MSIAVSVLTTSRVARNSGGAPRQESNPQSATAYSSVRYQQSELKKYEYLNFNGMKTIMTLFLLFVCITKISSQTYYYIDKVSTEPNNPTIADSIKIKVSGWLSDGCSYVYKSNYSIINKEINLNIIAAKLQKCIGASVLIPHDEFFNINKLDTGNYQIHISGYYILNSIVYDLKVSDIETYISNELSISSMILYPNPTQDNITIELNSQDKINSIKIINKLGQIVYSKQKTSTTNASEQIDISNFKQGVYFVKVQTDNGTIVKKFIKQ